MAISLPAPLLSFLVTPMGSELTLLQVQRMAPWKYPQGVWNQRIRMYGLLGLVRVRLLCPHSTGKGDCSTGSTAGQSRELPASFLQAASPTLCAPDTY